MGKLRFDKTLPIVIVLCLIMVLAQPTLLVGVQAAPIPVPASPQILIPGFAAINAGDVLTAKPEPQDAAPTITWTRQFGSSADEFAKGMARDGSGNVYVVGYTKGTVPGLLAGETSSGLDDAFIRKYNSLGVEQWTRQFGTTGNDGANGVAVDSGGSVYVVGYTGGTLPGETSSGFDDTFIRIYDSNGNVVFTRQFGTSGYDLANGVAVDGLGNYYIVGYTNGILGQARTGGYDAFIRKYNSSGTAAWTGQFGSYTMDFATGVAVDSLGNAYVAGSFGGEFFDVTIGAYLPYYGSTDYFIRKYDSGGTAVWTKQLGTTGDTNANEAANGVALDGLGNLYIVGFTYGALFGALSGPSDAFVSKYASSGDFLWGKQFGSSSLDEAFGVAVDSSSGNAYVVGKTFGALAGQTFRGGAYDAFVGKFDSLGNPSWTMQFGTNKEEEARGVALDWSGEAFFVSGYTNGALSGQTSAGVNDAFLLKLAEAASPTPTPSPTASPTPTPTRTPTPTPSPSSTPSPSPSPTPTATASPSPSPTPSPTPTPTPLPPPPPVTWINQFGSGGDDYAVGIAIDGTGYGWAVGYTEGTLPGQISSGGTDAFAARFDRSGNIFWTQQFGSSALDEAFGVALDAFGNGYVAGRTTGTLPGQTASGGTVDAFIRKIDPYSEMNSWTRQFGTAVYANATGVSVNSSGDAFVAGFTGGVFAGQASSGGVRDAFVRMYSGGSEVWTRQFGTGATSTGTLATGVAAISEGASSAYVVGHTMGAFPDQVSSGSQDAFIRKYDVFGNVVWTRQFGSTTLDGVAGVAVDPVGKGVYYPHVAGYTWGTLPGQGPSSGGIDAFVRKYDLNGAELWTRQFGTAGDDYTSAVVVDWWGNVYVTGSTTGAFPGRTSSGETDGFVRKYSPSGVELWTIQFGTSARDNPTGIAADLVGGAFVVGQTWGDITGGGSSGGSVGNAYSPLARPASAGGGDIFIMKLGETLIPTPTPAPTATPGPTPTITPTPGPTPTPTPAALPGDVNGDGVVNGADLALVMASFNKRTGDAGFNLAADTNRDGIVDIYDLVIVGLNFGRTN